MTTVNPEIATTLGLAGRPDLPPHVVAIIEGIGSRIVSPVVPEPLVATAKSVARFVHCPDAPAELVRDASDTLDHLRRVLGEVVPETLALQGPIDDLTYQLQQSLRGAETRRDSDAVLVLQAALGMTATAK